MDKRKSRMEQLSWIPWNFDEVHETCRGDANMFVCYLWCVPVVGFDVNLPTCVPKIRKLYLIFCVVDLGIYWYYIWLYWYNYIWLYWYYLFNNYMYVILNDRFFYDINHTWNESQYFIC